MNDLVKRGAFRAKVENVEDVQLLSLKDARGNRWWCTLSDPEIMKGHKAGDWVEIVGKYRGDHRVDATSCKVVEKSAR